MEGLNQTKLKRLAELIEAEGVLEKRPSEMLDLFGKKYIDGHDSDSLRYCFMVEMGRGRLPFRYTLETKDSDDPKDTNRVYVLEPLESHERALAVERLN